MAARESVSVDLDAEVAEILRQRAADAHISKGEIIDRAVRDGFETDPNGRPPGEERARRRSGQGIGTRGAEGRSRGPSHNKLMSVVADAKCSCRRCWVAPLRHRQCRPSAAPSVAALPASHLSAAIDGEDGARGGGIAEEQRVARTSSQAASAWALIVSSSSTRSPLPFAMPTPAAVLRDSLTAVLVGARRR